MTYYLTYEETDTVTRSDKVDFTVNFKCLGPELVLDPIEDIKIKVVNDFTAVTRLVNAIQSGGTCGTNHFVSVLVSDPNSLLSYNSGSYVITMAQITDLALIGKYEVTVTAWIDYPVNQATSEQDIEETVQTFFLEI